MNPDDLLNRVLADYNSVDTASRDPLPAGTYNAVITRGEFVITNTGKDAFRLTCRVDDGPHAGRQFFHSLYFSPAALAYTKADLTALGIRSLAELKTFPANAYRVKARVVVHKTDSGVEYNRVRSLELLERVQPKPDAFAPKSEGGA